jgi:putative inorganic carbon (HCO3(-)) transporter
MLGLLLFALALAGFAYVVMRPEWGAPYFAFLIFLRFSDVIRGEYGVPSLFMVLAPGLVLIAFVRWLVRGDRLGQGWRPALWLLVLYGAVCTASVLYATDTERTVEALLDYGDGIVIVLVMTLYLRTSKDLERTVWAIMAAGGILASLAIHQQLTDNVDATYGGFSHVELRNIFDRTAGFRSEGPASANYFALILVVVVPLAVERLLHAHGRIAKAVASATLAASLTAIVFTYSRGGLLALGMCCIPMLSWVPRRRIGRLIVVGGLAGVVAVAFVLPADYLQRLMALTQLAGAPGGDVPQDGALRGRLSEVTSAAMIFGDHPIGGVGYGNFEILYPRYAQVLGLDGRREERAAHSLYLEVAAETGIFGLLAFGALIGGAVLGAFGARRRLAELGDTHAEQIAQGFAFALFGYLAGSIFLHLTYPRYFWLLMGIGLALAALGRPEPADSRAPARSRPLVQGRA